MLGSIRRVHMSTIATALGTTIATKLAAMCLGRDVDPDLLESLVGVLTESGVKSKSARTVKRALERVADHVESEIEGALNGMTTSIPKDRLAVILREAADHVRTLQITTADILQYELDPRLLTSKILEQYPRGTFEGLDEVEEQVTVAFVTASAQLIIDLAKYFPAFTEEALKTIIQRERSIESKMDEMISKWSAAWGSFSSNQFDNFMVIYKSRIINSLDSMEIIGANIDRKLRYYPLSVSYINLTADLNLGAWSKNSFQSSGPNTEENKLRTVEDMLRQPFNSIILRGEAGTGKTTILKWISVQLARGENPQFSPRLRHRIPFYVRLREHSLYHEFPGPDALAAAASFALRSEVPKGWGTHLMTMGKVIILLDGLDELPTRRRILCVKWLRDMLVNFPNTLVIITTRPHVDVSDVQSAVAKSDCHVWDIYGMNRGQVGVFIDSWHKAVAAAAIEDGLPVNEQKISEDIIRLKRRINRSPEIRRLSATPMLCALLCAINYDGKFHALHDRVSLLAECVEMFFRREREREGVTQPEMEYVNPRDTKEVLSLFAFWMATEGLSEVDESQAIEVLGKIAQEFVGTRYATRFLGSIFLEAFVERIALLKRLPSGNVEFTHKLIQDIMTARAIRDENEVGKLLSFVDDTAWRDVTLLVAGLGGKAIADDLVSGILELVEDAFRSHKERASMYTLLAIECVAEAIRLSPKVKDRAHDWAARLVVVPPKSRDDEQLLIRAGSLACRVIERGDWRNWSTLDVSRVINVLCAIGNDDAIGVLYEKRDTSLVVKNHVLRAYGEFKDRARYERDILRTMTIERYIAPDDASVKAVMAMFAIEHLVILDTVKTWDLQVLTKPKICRIEAPTFTGAAKDIRNLIALDLSLATENGCGSAVALLKRLDISGIRVLGLNLGNPKDGLDEPIARLGRVVEVLKDRMRNDGHLFLSFDRSERGGQGEKPAISPASTASEGMPTPVLVPAEPWLAQISHFSLPLRKLQTAKPQVVIVSGGWRGLQGRRAKIGGDIDVVFRWEVFDNYAAEIVKQVSAANAQSNNSSPD
jgi:hypothetical protein